MNYNHNMLYIRPWGSTGAYKEFPYKPDGQNNTIPDHDAGQNDVDLDSYTNTAGKTIRNRVRANVKTLDFNVSEMSGQELKDFFAMTNDVWLDCYFFDEVVWGFVSKKMYRSATVKYHKYYMHETNPLLNQYTDIQFGFVEE